MMPNGLQDRQLTLMEVDIELNLTPFPDLSAVEIVCRSQVDQIW
jgi:hypothetical protein